MAGKNPTVRRVKVCHYKGIHAHPFCRGGPCRPRLRPNGPHSGCHLDFSATPKSRHRPCRRQPRRIPHRPPRHHRRSRRRPTLDSPALPHPSRRHPRRPMASFSLLGSLRQRQPHRAHPRVERSARHQSARHHRQASCRLERIRFYLSVTRLGSPSFGPSRSARPQHRRRRNCRTSSRGLGLGGATATHHRPRRVRRPDSKRRLA